MPTFPSTPTSILASIPTPSGSFCEKMLRFLIDYPTLIYNNVAFAINEDGSLSDDFKSMICAIDCDALAAGGGSSLIAAPTVTITFAANPRINWTAVANAAYYEVLRGDTTDIVNADLLTVTPLNFYDDVTTSPSTQYWYFVRGINATDQGSFSVATPGGQAVYTLTAPTIIDATDSISTHVNISWSRIDAASLYDVIRNTANTTSGATTVGTTSELYFNDLNVPFGTAQYYFVRARSPIATSAYSSSNVGERA